ncbi:MULTISPECIES: hypothetical protein [unclassified Gordonia (in: high G+C Gram-positive bacteria)]
MTDVDPDHATVGFGFPLTMGAGEIPEILAAYRHRHRGVTLHHKQAHGQQLVVDLTSGERRLWRCCRMITGCVVRRVCR